MFIDFAAAFDSVSHRLLDESLAAANASDKSRAIFRAIYTEAAGEMVSIKRGVVQGDIASPYILVLAFLFSSTTQRRRPAPASRSTASGRTASQS